MKLFPIQLFSVFSHMYQKHIGTEMHYESRAGSITAIAKRWEEKAKQLKGQFEEKYCDY